MSRTDRYYDQRTCMMKSRIDFEWHFSIKLRCITSSDSPISDNGAQSDSCFRKKSSGRWDVHRTRSSYNNIPNDQKSTRSSKWSRPSWRGERSSGATNPAVTDTVPGTATVLRKEGLRVSQLPKSAITHEPWWSSRMLPGEISGGDVHLSPRTFDKKTYLCE